MHEIIGRGFPSIPSHIVKELTSSTVVATTSGTSLDITGIPSWVNKITVMLDNVSTNGVSVLILQLGDSGGIETTGYLGTCVGLVNTGAVSAASFTNGFGLVDTMAATTSIQGLGTLALLDASTNTWAWHGGFGRNDSTTSYFSNGGKSLSATLNMVRLTTNNGTDAFDLGKFKILYE